jgi:RNA polymerase sigma-70 factor, ECF subfamily
MSPAVWRRRMGALARVHDHEDDDEGTWARAARSGDRVAFARLYDRHRRCVRGILLARAPRQELEDLAQEVFLRALHRLETLRDPDAFGPWIAAIARNVATDRLRRGPEPRDLPDELPGGDPSDGEAAMILATIRALPETYRETLMLRLVQGLTGPEIAAQTGMTPGSVRVHLHRGIKLLREALHARGAHVG